MHWQSDGIGKLHLKWGKPIRVYVGADVAEEEEHFHTSGCRSVTGRQPAAQVEEVEVKYYVQVAIGSLSWRLGRATCVHPTYVTWGSSRYPDLI